MISFREEKHENKIDLSLIKKVRVVCDDPYATESSSEDESISRSNPRRPIKPKPPKRFISEICVPTLIETNSNSTAGKRVLGNRKSSSGFKGVRRRPRGKFAPEIRNPFEKKGKWLGTFTTEEAAAEAYERSKRELDEQLGRVNQTGLVKPEEEGVDFTKHDDLLPSPLEKTFGFGFGYADEEESMIDKMLEYPLLPVSISDIFGDLVDDEPYDFWVDYNLPEVNSIFDEPKIEYVEKTFGFKNGDDTAKVIEHMIESILDDGLFGSTDLHEFDPIMDDFGLLEEPEVDGDYSLSNGTTDWTDTDL